MEGGGRVDGDGCGGESAVVREIDFAFSVWEHAAVARYGSSMNLSLRFQLV